MTIQTLPDDPDYVFCAEELPGDGMYRIVIAVDDLDKIIPTTLISLTLDNALHLCDGMNRRLGHPRTEAGGETAPPRAKARTALRASLRVRKPPLALQPRSRLCLHLSGTVFGGGCYSAGGLAVLRSASRGSGRRAAVLLGERVGKPHSLNYMAGGALAPLADLPFGCPQGSAP